MLNSLPLRTISLVAPVIVSETLVSAASFFCVRYPMHLKPVKIAQVIYVNPDLFASFLN
jgi:hypothetical protein